MGLSKEWEEVHLTPNGWINGSSKYDFNEMDTVEIPTDAVLTIRRHEVITSMYSKPDRWDDIKKHTTDEDLIERLLIKYGDPPFSIKKGSYK